MADLSLNNAQRVKIWADVSQNKPKLSTGSTPKFQFLSLETILSSSSLAYQVPTKREQEAHVAQASVPDSLPFKQAMLTFANKNEKTGSLTWVMANARP